MSCAAAYARKNLVVMPIRDKIDLDDGFLPLLGPRLEPLELPEPLELLLLPLPELLRASSSGLSASFLASSSTSTFSGPSARFNRQSRHTRPQLRGAAPKKEAPAFDRLNRTASVCRRRGRGGNPPVRAPV